MAIEHDPSPEIDLDRTDKLPILEGVSIDDDVADDSVRLEYAATPSAAPGPSSPSQPAAESVRAGADLPSLADSVRSVEERIAWHNAEYEALNRLYEKARDAQLAAGNRADSLAVELSTAHSALAVEQHRVRELERKISESVAAADTVRSRAEESWRETERAKSEARTLREELTARDATIAQVLHSLGERDAQLFALQREHAQTVPALEARSRVTKQLETELKSVRENVETLTAELRQNQQARSVLDERLARAESELIAGSRDLKAARAQEAIYLEVLRSRDWRSGFNQNLQREADEARRSERSDESALRAECEQLREAQSSSSSKLAAYETAISKLQAAGGAQAAELAQKSQDLEENERALAELQARLDRLAGESQRAREEQAAADARLVVADARLAAADQRLAAADERLAGMSSELEQLRAGASTHEEELTVLMAHLNEARRPMQSVQADIKRLNEDLALKSHAIEQLTEQNRAVRTTLERTRGALEERELLIRRLERSANNNANVLGRLQTSIERLGSNPSTPIAGEFLAELIKVEGNTRTAYPLGRRTRIGRSPGCELQIDSQSVSRHHALLLKGVREIIVEDLNSTNGMLVNGRKVTRQVLSDGDVLTIGETQFQCRLKPHLHGPEIPPRGPEPPWQPAAVALEAPPPTAAEHSDPGAAGEAPPAGEPRPGE